MNAGTVEFLFQDGEFYFLEMNTRLQVEHPVTELVTGLDLVRWQLHIASGEALPFGQGDIVRRGHAIEVRINAEDPSHGRFTPSPGTIRVFDPPAGPGVRLEAGNEAGDTYRQYYDNLVAKLVVWAEDREAARRRMLRALGETEIAGVATTIPADVAILSHPDFADATHSTKWVEETLDLSGVTSGAGRRAGPDRVSRTTPPGAARRDRRGRRPALPGQALGARHRRQRGGGGPAGTTWPTPTSAHGIGRRAGSGSVTVPMQGTIVKVLVAVGDPVEVGQTVCILEAMKMENAINAEKAGVVREVRVAAGDSVGSGDIVAIVE